MESLATTQTGESWRSGRVVVVDDNRASAFLLAEFLQSMGHEAEVLEPSALDELVEAILAKRPDVVFLDLLLGTLNGHDIARSLRQCGCEAYLVAVTGWGEPDDRAYSLEVGFDEHWTKPLDTLRVEQFMRRRPQRAEAAAG